jgi:uncharacterized DUF497 family protein
MIVVWDEPKRAANLAKHGIDFADLGPDYFLAAIIVPAHRDRFMALGRLGEFTISVVFAPLGAEAISIISARPASRAERNLLP